MAIDEKGHRQKIDRRLIVFTRYPEPGNTKTRLIPLLGPEGAAELQRQMTEHTVRRARMFRNSHPDAVEVEVRYDGGSRQQLAQWLGHDLRFSPQGEGDLGRRLVRAFQKAFQAGLRAVIIIGSDCPGIKADDLSDAFAKLKHNDLVIGPASDGGYYLIGLRRELPLLFDGIPWGSDQVFSRTMHIAGSNNFNVATLAPLDDVDRPEDLAVWGQERQVPNHSFSSANISIIIPALNEGDTIGQTLKCTQAAKEVIERIVVDGGSSDATVQEARAHGAEVMVASQGKARQMNAGARVAKGDTLLFLHADTWLPQGFAVYVNDILAKPGTVAGAFRHKIDGKERGLRIVERMADFRSFRIGMPYGDQAIFLKAKQFYDIGGFPDIPLMEDFELMRRMLRLGRVEIAPVGAVTSARRYYEKGILWTTLLNQIIIIAHLAGVSPHRLARWYRGRFHSVV